MKRVIIAEKPSVAKNIAEALDVRKRQDGYFESEKYFVTWAFGHLLQLYDAKDYDENMKGWALEKFPFIPDEFRYKVKSDGKDRNVIDQGAKKQLKIIKSLMDREDVDSIISATDFDREGQVIADEIFLYCKEKKPIYRILLNEWTPDEVRKGMNSLKSNKDMKPLQDAGMGRQWADWLIGINLTSVATVKYNSGNKSILNVGRVLLPTLKIIYDRDKEIENFKSSTYYKLLSMMKTQKGESFESTYYEMDKDNKYTEKFDDKSKLEQICSKIAGTKAMVIDKQVEAKKEYAPFLFNLSNLQGYVTSKYNGWTSDKVLKVAQSLYEKKFITYPRTGSIALEESLKERALKVLEVHKKGLPYEDKIKFVDNKRIFDNSKVESHSAIIPTYVKATGLTADEQVVYNAVKDRFIMQFMPVAEFEETRITMKLSDSSIPGIFFSRGKVQIVEGWRIIEKISSEDTILPMLSKNEEVLVEKPVVGSVTRKPPKPHTEKTLLKVMETCGKSVKEGGNNAEEMMASILSGFSIGTPATRADTIKKLKDANYVESKGKSLVCTDLGRSLVEIFPVKQLLDLEYTGKLEKTLSDIEKGKVKKEDFLNMIKTFTNEAVSAIKNDKSQGLSGSKASTNSQGSTGSYTKEVLGKCPNCGADVVEGKNYYLCSQYNKNGCKFIIGKAILDTKITKTDAKALLSGKETKSKSFKWKSGKTGEAKLVLNGEKIEFVFEKKQGQ